MKYFLNANLSPKLARWLSDNFNVDCVALRDIGAATKTDEEIFALALKDSGVVITKDADFVHLVNRRGSPPHIILLSVGNCSNKALNEILKNKFAEAKKLIESGQSIVEIRK